ncbi:hypothetical protein [Fictibacillus barbaricus]|uniref:Uncharacterized protein n=1 Tax=Fictibacillus barbaricus TaxID=182136 RepID=A0ABS2Z9I3_9BACL|nr:hypothetical protein [Fictibacillus barbaricus]MBN3544287.1 hypothetical protein [Fictibacillus barbaricus]
MRKALRRLTACPAESEHPEAGIQPRLSLSLNSKNIENSKKNDPAHKGKIVY